ncbi:MAG: hypothetical protein PHF29_10465 [Candidatus Riflebacteria bacterium]|nr:hypothetical protein [Candidatus Riflebacteria bacterium]
MESKTPRTLSEPKSYTDLEYAVMYKSMCEKLETALAEAQAEIERLNKNMRFATAINLAMQEAGQDLPDLRGHECLAKHKLLSLFDFWRKKVKPRLPGFIDDEISQRDKLIEQMREALKACVEFIHHYDKEHNIGDGKVLEQAIVALLVAERVE